MYGPHYPLHNERYFKSKVFPKLLDDKTQMFRFYSCKFRIEKSKVKTARVVLFREYGIMNCFTLEASFHGFIDKDRGTTELTTESLQEMGGILGHTMCDYNDLVDEDERQKAQVREALRSKKKKLKARDIAKAIIRQEKNAVVQQRDPENGACVSNSDTDFDMQSSNAVTKMSCKSKGPVRSMSIQNGATSKNHVPTSLSDTNNSDENTTAGDIGTTNSRKQRATAASSNLRMARNSAEQATRSV